MIDTNLLKITLLKKAISGKLSTSFEGEDVNNLLEGIIRAKQGIRNKKPKYVSILDLELSIPKSWKMVRLGEIAESQLGKTINSKKDTGIETKYLCNINITNIGLSLDPLKSTLFSAKELKDYQVHSGDLLVCEGGEVGKNIIYQLPDVIHYQNALYRIRFFGGMNPFYPKLVLDYLKGIGYLNRLGKGVGIQHLNQSLLNSLPIPLPPLEEQKRIVAKIEELFAKIDEIDKAQKELKELAELAEKKVLDMAVRGELVEQDENDNGVEDLLSSLAIQKERRISSKKMRRDKEYPPIKTELAPFPIPQNWKWLRLCDLAEFKKGPFGSKLKKDSFVPYSVDSIKVYEQQNAIKKDHLLGHYYISKEKYKELKTFTVFPGDIIISCAGTIGEIYKLPQDASMGIINQALMYARSFDSRCDNYFLLYFDYVLKQQARIDGKGSAMSNIPPFDVLKPYPFPVPPIEEQNRIIKKVNHIKSILSSFC